MTLDSLTRVLLEHIGELGYIVGVALCDGHVVTATAPDGERWTVRGPDLYKAVCELAVQVGAELTEDDGKPLH